MQKIKKYQTWSGKVSDHDIKVMSYDDVTDMVQVSDEIWINGITLRKHYHLTKSPHWIDNPFVAMGLIILFYTVILLLCKLVA